MNLTYIEIDAGFVVVRDEHLTAGVAQQSLTSLSEQAAFVPLVLLWIFSEDHLRAVWRLTFGLGIVPAALVLLWRLKMPSEPERYRKSAIQKNVPYRLILKRYWRSLLGVSLCWFLYE